MMPGLGEGRGEQRGEEEKKTPVCLVNPNMERM